MAFSISPLFANVSTISCRLASTLSLRFPFISRTDGKDSSWALMKCLQVKTANGIKLGKGHIVLTSEVARPQRIRKWRKKRLLCFFFVFVFVSIFFNKQMKYRCANLLKIYVKKCESGHGGAVYGFFLNKMLLFLLLIFFSCFYSPSHSRLHKVQHIAGSHWCIYVTVMFCHTLSFCFLPRCSKVLR